MIKQIANIVTGWRIVGSVLLFFSPAFSIEFYMVYILCGFSDMIDGAVARKTNSTGSLGSQLDTAADLVFTTAALVKLLPAIRLPGWLWIWGGVIAVLKISNILWGYASAKQFLSLHTTMNRLVGLLLFLLPLTISFADIRYSSAAVCIPATFAAIREGVYVAKIGKTGK